MFALFLISTVLSDPIVDFVNNHPTATWKAFDYPPEVMTRAKMFARLGMNTLPTGPSNYAPSVTAPAEFDARKQWPGKILPVRDQGHCGSCWAFAATETAGNRLAILGCGRGHMAPQDLVSCDYLDQGCNGGNPMISWAHIRLIGITTEDCMPYVSGDGRVPTCPKTCKNGSEIVRTKAQSFKHVDGATMQDELYNHGPFEVAMMVYEDFKAYKSGVYHHVTGEFLGGHAVLAMGWGVENGTPYWLIQNSWAEAWGEQGFFKILRGTDECGIESLAFSGAFKC